MSIANTPILSLVTFLPLVGALLIMLMAGGDDEAGRRNARWIALWTTIITFAVSLPIWVTLLCFIAFGVLLNQTVYGRNTLAIGGNPEASRLAGINVERTRVYIFLIQGAVTALAGVIPPASSSGTVGNNKPACCARLQSKA